MKTEEIVNKKISGSSHAVDKLCLKYGVLTTISLILYFFVMKLIGLVEHPELRMFNFIFLAAGIFMAMKAYSRSGKMESIEYFQGLKIGVYTTLISAGLFAIFTGIYLALNHHFLTLINENTPFAIQLTPLIAAASILLEGLASGVIVSFVAMQYFKKNREE